MTYQSLGEDVFWGVDPQLPQSQYDEALSRIYRDNSKLLRWKYIDGKSIEEMAKLAGEGVTTFDIGMCVNCALLQLRKEMLKD
jgi:hypothetical protein